MSNLEAEKVTWQSEYLTLESVVLNPVQNAFAGEGKIQAGWQDLNYTRPPNYESALEEYRLFEGLLLERGIRCLHLPNAPQMSLDALYCRDASIATNHGIILCNMGKPQRQNEPDIQEAYYTLSSIPILGRIKPPGTLEGGDVAWLDETTLAVGHSYRTNNSGIEQLIGLLSPFGIEVVVVELPHYRGATDVFHLMSVISPVSTNHMVAYSPLLPIGFRNQLLDRGIELIEVPGQEFESLGCNVLALAPDTCMMVSGNPITASALRAKGFTVLTYKGEEISLKGGGGPTCLTRPLGRKR